MSFDVDHSEISVEKEDHLQKRKTNESKKNVKKLPYLGMHVVYAARLAMILI